MSVATPTDDDLVWHYTDGNGLLSILANHCLWATSAAFLNDQHEVALGGRLMVERFQQRARSGDSGGLAAIADEVDQQTATGQGPSASRFYILSASQTGDSLAMWRLYGARGLSGPTESYAIGLDPSVPLTVLGTDVVDEQHDGLAVLRQPWQPVHYRPADQNALVDSLIDDLVRTAPLVGSAAGRPDPRGWDDDTRAAVQAVTDRLQEVLLLIKHRGFEDERESRQAVMMFANPDDPDAVAAEARILRYRSTPYGIAPYLQLTGHDPDAPGTGAVTGRARHLPIRAVAISPSPNGDAATDSVRQVLAANGYTGADVLRSAIPFRG